MQSFRDEFAVTHAWSYLNHAAFGPLPARTIAAVENYSRRWANPAEYDLDADPTLVQEVREAIARLSGSDPSLVAFVGSLAEGMSLLANGIDWQAGDNVVIPAEEFPSLVYPFLNLGHRGVTVRFVEKNAEGRTDYERLEAAMDGRTRAVAVSHVEFQDGYRNDLRALGDLCTRRGTELFVDVTQSLGAQPLDVAGSGVTAVTGHSYKWLMASFGVAPVIFSEGAIERIRPTYAGRMSVEAGWEDLEFKLEYKPDAGRYQTGGFNMLGLTALHASLSLVEEVSPAASARHTTALIDRLVAGAQESGYRVVSSMEPDSRSQIVTITSGDAALDERIVADLEARNVSVALRGRGIRISPYFYNNDEDIDRLLEALPPR